MSSMQSSNHVYIKSPFLDKRRKSVNRKRIIPLSLSLSLSATGHSLPFLDFKATIPSMSKKESMDSVDKIRRRGSAPKAGSIWESRMKIDQVKGGIKVFTDDENAPKSEIEIAKTNQSPIGKRKTWKSESSPVKIAVSRSEFSDSIKRSPIPTKASDDDGDKYEGKVGVDERVKNSVDDKQNKSRSDEDCEAKISSNDAHKQDFHQKIVIEEKRLVHSNKKSEPISPIAQKQPLPYQTTPKTNTNLDNFHRIQRTSSKLRSFVDVIMWRDASKTAFVFGTGTFAIISSSYTADLNISFISLLSYLGLVYLAAIFLFRSLISRGSVEKDNANQDCVIGEEEAIWVMKILVPYINEFLLKLRALFSGDPATTMKLALLLFILARCGSSITIWTMAKLGFIGIFTVPKVCSMYSSQLAAYGTFWMRRFGDAWASCPHKKAVGFAVFALVWNLSSVIARIWAAFMLFVAFKHYQSIQEEPINTHHSSTLPNTGKQNKVF